MTLPNELKEGKTYIIIYTRDTRSKFIGTFCNYIRDTTSASFNNVVVHYSIYVYDNFVINHYKDYRYYDVEKINNAKNARENFEKRSLDIILKKLINENFEW